MAYCGLLRWGNPAPRLAGTTTLNRSPGAGRGSVWRWRQTSAGSADARSQWSWIDIVVAAGVVVLFYAVLRVGRGTTVSFTPAHNLAINTDPTRLPYYAVRSLLRMFVALGCSFAFSFAWA